MWFFASIGSTPSTPGRNAGSIPRRATTTRSRHGSCEAGSRRRATRAAGSIDSTRDRAEDGYVRSPRVPASAWLALMLAIALAATGCSSAKRKSSVPIDSRPTPAQPSAADSARTAKPAPMSQKTKTTAAQRIAADTLEVRKALRECQGVKLLPDQEGIVDSANALLVRVRDAIAKGDLASAESRARQARQMTASLRCK
jgi:hypothetical protein